MEKLFVFTGGTGLVVNHKEIENFLKKEYAGIPNLCADYFVYKMLKGKV